jgi:hypothetical protein
MWSFRTLADEFFVGSRLYLKLDLQPTRESVLHLFEQLRKHYPRLSRFRRRDDGSVLLDQPVDVDATDDTRRYVRLGNEALKFGTFAPPDRDTVEKFANLVLSLAPPALTLSDLDLDHLEVVYGFDLEYAGNHDEIVADTLFGDSSLIAGLRGDREHIIECQPSFGVTLSEDCAVQAYIDVKSRTNTFEVRTNEYQTQALSVYLTVRRYWTQGTIADLPQLHGELLRIGDELVGARVVPHVVQPLAAAIASRR